VRAASYGFAAPAKIQQTILARKSGPHHADRVTSAMVMRLEILSRTDAILHSTSLVNRASMVVTDAEPDRLAPLAPPAPLGLSAKQKASVCAEWEGAR
jgi:hypothetical protein